MIVLLPVLHFVLIPSYFYSFDLIFSNWNSVVIVIKTVGNFVPNRVLIINFNHFLLAAVAYLTYLRSLTDSKEWRRVPGKLEHTIVRRRQGGLREVRNLS